MNCWETRLRLDDYLDARLDAPTMQAVEAHLAACGNCSDHLRVERLLRERLRDLPVPPPSGHFARRVLAAARPQRPAAPRPVYRLLAAAALLAVVAGGALLALRPELGGAEPVVTVAGGSVQRLRLVFNSPGALSGVTMHVDLPEGVELVQYPGVHELTWEADLKPGANLLALPVIVRGGGGTVLASVSLGGEKRQFTVQLQAGPHDGAALPRALKLSSVAPYARET
jgi:anti-sigma factor RsiW